MDLLSQSALAEKTAVIIGDSTPIKELHPFGPPLPQSKRD
ncbi:MAG: hypothetical protein DHS20C20_29480 [Ardenticatenaceae bacterium]|nr:MAG: hypothetical protein DHS20C20_29480 [Ardenticatenaceae bacterium]